MPAGPAFRKEISYTDAMIGSLQLYIENYRLFLSLSFSGVGLVILKMIMDGLGGPLGQGLGFILTPLAFGFGTLFYTALIFAVHKRRLNEPTSFLGAVLAVFPKFWRAVGAALVFGLIFILGILLLVIPGVYWLTVLYFFMYLLVLEDKRLWDTFEASSELVKGRFWKILGAHGLIAVMALALIMPFYLGMWLLGMPGVFREACVQVLWGLLMPFSIGFYYFLYVWLRERNTVAGHITVYEKK
jgi:hypothetical protein